MQHSSFCSLKSLLLAVLSCFFLLGNAQTTDANDKRQRVKLETNMGDIVIALYDETPRHRDNFVKLVKEGFYDSLLFHRVIEDFMIQGGDPDSRHALPGAPLGEGGPGYDLPAEICFPQLFHKRGAVAAAREGDDVNPERKSSGSQFYIVWGKMCSHAMVNRARLNIKKITDGQATISEAMEEIYALQGGTPHLDAGYTVFGEVVEGLETTVYAIQTTTTDDNNRPFDDIRILKATVLEPETNASATEGITP